MYEILGVPRNASQADIKKAYRQLVKQYHPDAHPGDKSVEEKFKKINAAYTVLNDPEKRARYDQFGTTGPGNDNPFGGMGGVDLGDLFGDIFSQAFGGGFGGFGGARRNPNAPQRGRDIETIINITLLEAMKGVSRDVEFSKAENCQHCNGTGAKPGTKPETCPHCRGQGSVRTRQQTMFGVFESINTCSECHGTGKIIKDKCDECHGTGRVRKKQNRSVKIPAGVANNMRLMIHGAGEDGINGGDSGDLYLVINVEVDKNFERDGADLHTTLLITYPQAVLGSEAEIKTLDGTPEKLTIPAGTQHGDTLKLRGKGMPKLNSPLNVSGDLYVHVYIDIPKEITDKQRELIKALADEMKAPVSNEANSGLLGKFRSLFK